MPIVSAGVGPACSSPMGNASKFCKPTFALNVFFPGLDGLVTVTGEL